MINKIIEEDLFGHELEYDCVLLYADIYSTMTNGLPGDIRTKYKYVLETNIKTKYGDLSKMGTILECKEENKPTFCLCYIVKDMFTKKCFLEKDTCQYEDLIKCLKLVNIRYKNKKIASPILGSSNFDGNGDKTKLIEIFEKYLTNVTVDLYDYEQISKNKKWLLQYHKGKQIFKEKGREAYYAYIREEKLKKKREKENEGKT